MSTLFETPHRPAVPVNPSRHMMMRPYQTQAVEAVFEQFQEAASTLLVAATGTGKTVMMSHIIDRVKTGRVMVIAHRSELIDQASATIHKVTGHRPEVEMAMEWADGSNYHKAKVVVASVQTLNAGMGGDGRMSRFDPADFALLLIDEAHHATAETYRRVIRHFRQNPALKVLGVTATPDRADEEALGQVFETVAFEYDVADAINDGWLVPIVQQCVVVEGLDFSAIRTTAGDLNGRDLADVMEYERNLHEVAGPTMEIARGRQTLVFAASVAHAERLCEIFNRHQPDSARWVTGMTPRQERRQMFADFGARRFQLLCNVGVVTEGTDVPGIEVVAMARPTKSRSLYAQMLGRGTRPLPGLVDMIPTAEERRARIAGSAKPHCEVIDFVGNAGRHKLITPADILGGNYSDEAVELAGRMAQEQAKAGKPADVAGVLELAQQQIERERREAEERERRQLIRAQAVFRTQAVNPFNVLHLQPKREKGWDTGKPITDKMRAMLERNGISTEGLSRTQAGQLCGEIIARWKSDRATYKQVAFFAKRGIDASAWTKRQASDQMNAIAQREGWKRRAS